MWLWLHRAAAVCGKSPRDLKPTPLQRKTGCCSYCFLGHGCGIIRSCCGGHGVDKWWLGEDETRQDKTELPTIVSVRRRSGRRCRRPDRLEVWLSLAPCKIRTADAPLFKIESAWGWWSARGVVRYTHPTRVVSVLLLSNAHSLEQACTTMTAANGKIHVPHGPVAFGLCLQCCATGFLPAQRRFGCPYRETLPLPPSKLFALRGALLPLVLSLARL